MPPSPSGPSSRVSPGVSRAVAAASTLAVLAIVVALTTAILVGVSGWVAVATAAASGQAVASAVGASGALIVSAPVGSSAEAATADVAAEQDAAVTAFLDDRFAGTGVRVSRTASLGAVEVAVDAGGDGADENATGGGVVRAVIVADETVADDAVLVDGAWPEAGGTAVQEAAAQRLGIEVGDAVTVPSSGVVLIVSGTWRPADDLAARWAGRPAFTSGRDGADLGPFVVTGEQLTALGGIPRSEWVVVPGGEPTPAQVSAIAEAADPTSVEGALDVAGAVSTDPVEVSGGLGETARRAARATRAATDLTSAALLLLVLVVALGSSRLLVLGSRRREGGDLLLRARGASRVQLRRWSVAEAAVVVLPAAALGAAGGWAALGALGGSGGAVGDGEGGAGIAAPIDPVGLVATTALVIALLGIAIAQPVPLPPLGTRALPAGALRIIGLAVLVVAAAVAVGQLLSSPGELGSAGIAAAPLALTAASVAASAALAAWARRSRSFGGRARSPWLFTALRSLRVRANWFTAVALVVMLASALCVVAATLPGAVQAAQRSVVSDELGADAAVQLDSAPVVSARSAPGGAGLLAALGDTPGTRAVSAVLVTTVAVGRESVRAVALPAEQGRALTGTGFLPDSPRPVGLGAETRSVSVRVTAEERDRPGSLTGTAWLASGGGLLAAVDLGTVPLDAADGCELNAALPDGFADAELLAIDLRYDAAADPDIEHVSLDSVSGLDAAGTTTAGYDVARLSETALKLTSSQAVGRVLVDDPDAPVPVTLSAGAAAELGLGVGDDVGFTPASGRTLEATVQRVVPSVPGVGGSPGLALDLADFARASLKASSSLLAPATLWVATDDLHAVAGVTASVSDSPWSIGTRDQAGASAFLSTGTAAWLLVAGVAVLMAFVATAANGAVLRRARRSEETTLRALGFVDRQRRLRRLAESGVAVGAALAAGLVIGVLVAALCTPVMGASAVGGRTVDSPFSDVGVPLLAGLLGALLVVLAAATLLASAEPRSGRPR